MNEIRGQRRFSGWIVCFLALVLVGNSGCFSGAKKIFHEVKGGEGKLVILQDPSPAGLLEYQNIRIEPFANQFAPKVPSYTPELIQTEIVKALSKPPQIYRVNPSDSAEGPTLIIRGSIIHFQATSGITSVISGYAQLICRVQLVDAGSGEVVGEANCVGFSKAIARSGLEELGEGVADAVKKWLTTESKEDDPKPVE